MLFKPRDGVMWDTWIVPHEGRYHLYWLRATDPASLSWDSFGLAVSDDLLHWEEMDLALRQSPDAEDWMGTGRVWRAGGRFLLNYSEISRGAQTIKLAESDDLVHWRKLGPAYDIPPDPRWYVTRIEEQPECWVHWDCLVPVPLDAGGWVGFTSCHALELPMGARATIGRLTSSDGLHWQPGPPVRSDPVPHSEVSGYARFGNRHYLFVTVAEVMGPRYDAFSAGRQATGMGYVCAERAEGPYAPPGHDHLLHGDRIGGSEQCAAFGTPFPVDGRWLWNHHFITNDRRGWLGPIKELVETAPWHLALRYWEGNDGLRSRPATWSCDAAALRFPQPVEGRPLCAEWRCESRSLAGATEGGAGLAIVDLQGVSKSGCMLTADLVITRAGGDGAGLFVGGSRENPADGLAILLHPEGRATLGRTSMGWATPVLHWLESFALPAFPGGRIRLRALLRGEYVEIYADDWLLRTLRLRPGERFTGTVGLWIDRCSARLGNLDAWALDP
jgi:hypothetical protein